MYVIDNILVQPLLYHMACTLLVAWLKKLLCLLYITTQPTSESTCFRSGFDYIMEARCFLYQCTYGIILIVIAFISEVLRSFLFDFSYMK